MLALIRRRSAGGTNRPANENFEQAHAELMALHARARPLWASNRRDTVCLRPAEFVAGAPLGYLRSIIPQLAIGWVYQPLVRQHVHLDVDFNDAWSLDEEFAETVLPAARDAALGWTGDGKSEPSSSELDELWDAAADDPHGPVGECVYWERKRLYLAIVPLQSESNPTVCFWIERQDLYGQELIQEIGRTLDDDRPVENWAATEHYTSDEQHGVCLIRDFSPSNHDEGIS